VEKKKLPSFLKKRECSKEIFLYHLQSFFKKREYYIIMFKRNLQIESDDFAIYTIPEILDNTHPLFVLHHGGGHCAAVWTKCANQLHEINPNASILAYDCRGHGTTNQ
jgi:hypothetical protein